MAFSSDSWALFSSFLSWDWSSRISRQSSMIFCWCTEWSWMVVGLIWGRLSGWFSGNSVLSRGIVGLMGLVGLVGLAGLVGFVGLVECFFFHFDFYLLLLLFFQRFPGSI